MDILEEQIVIILIGLPGSAKSTFSNALVKASSDPEWNSPRPLVPVEKEPDGPSDSDRLDETGPDGSDKLDGNVDRLTPVKRKWTRISQDDSPSRRRQECEMEMRLALDRGENVIVDRVNFDPV